MKFLLIIFFTILSMFSNLSRAQDGDFYYKDEDSIVVVAAKSTESEDKNLRSGKQFISVTGFGQYPGFAPGWPFGGSLKPVPPTPPKLGQESCVTVRGDYGICATLRQCYPVLYTALSDNETETGVGELRNPGLADILRAEVSGPCDEPQEISNQFLFRADAEYRRKLICCPNQTPILRPETTTKQPFSPPTQRTVPPFQKPIKGQQFGQRPPSPTKPPIRITTTSQPIISSSCGIPKIVGGKEATVGKYPWMAALMNGNKQFCGASLIDSQHLLTAAHCVSHMRPNDVARVRVLLGAHNIYQVTPGTVVKKVSKLSRHMFFSHQTLHNDVAVLKLESPVKFTDYISPICLASGRNRFSNYQATVAGWGSVSENGAQPQTLREVTIEVWPNERCKGKYGHLAPGGITDNMVCAGSVNRDACRGDSGGPLMSNTGSYFEQIGIVSWGIGCGRYPGVYSRVTDFMDWITRNIK